MRFQEALQVRLQERYRRLYKSKWGDFDANVRYLMEWAEGTPALAALFSAIERAEPELDPAAWWDGVSRHGETEWPASEVGRAKVVLWQLRQIGAGEAQGRGIALLLSSQSNMNEAIRDLCSDAIEPLIEYLQERLGAESDMLYLLERYRRWVAWFEQDDLWAKYQADTRRGEALYDNHLRRFLFDQGVDYPMSQPASPSGKVDMLADVDSDDPLSCEVKLFDGDSYGVSYLAKGFQQAHRYAEDYGHTAAHLVVFNLTARQLELPSDDTDVGWPPRLNLAGVTVFIVVVQAAPRQSASRSGAAKPIVVGRADLVVDSG